MADTPITVNASALPAQLAAAGRTLTILVAGATALLSFASSHDVAGAWAWLHSTDGAGFLAAVVASGTFAYGMYRRYVDHSEKVTLADDSALGEVKR